MASSSNPGGMPAAMPRPMPEATVATGDTDLHPPLIRMIHWINAIAIVVMIGSGWRIYNDSPLIAGFHFPDTFTIGGNPAVSDAKWQNHAYGGLQWHFAMMWVLMINGLVYLSYGLYTGRLRRMMLPITVAGVMVTIRDTLSFKLNHEHGVYNHVQRLLYVGVIAAIVLVVLSGLAMWKQVQFPLLASLFISFQGARWVHFICMVAIVLFMLVHVALALLVPSTLRSMTIGEDRLSKLE